MSDSCYLIVQHTTGILKEPVINSISSIFQMSPEVHVELAIGESAAAGGVLSNVLRIYNGEHVELVQRTGLNPSCKYYQIKCSGSQVDRIMQFARDQCGKRFSVPGMIRSIVFPRVSHYNQENWFCAELVAFALREGGLL